MTDSTVEFEQVTQGFRNLLTPEFGYHHSVGQLATAVARIQQAGGIDNQPQLGRVAVSSSLADGGF